MEFERSHRSGGGATSSSSSELFICFTSRPSFSSSASMKASSKSILSPNRGGSDKYKEQQPTLSFSSSMNRRLGSMKAGQSSPMFKKRGNHNNSSNGFENAEPSSPKVTCIGQVRVKTKKQGKKMMSLGKKENTSTSSNVHQVVEGECLPHGRNQKWPIAICEALRGFGSEFTCFLPCGRSACSSRTSRGEKRRTMSSCGAVFAKWLMALQEGEEQEEEDEKIRVIVGEEEKKDDFFKEIRGNGEVQYEEGRFSICIPPKNALLLMRCRSEPVKLAALANRFWESPIKDEDDDENSADEEDDSGVISVPWASIEEEILRKEWDSVKFVEEQDVLIMDENPLNQQLGSSKDVEEQELKEELSLAKDVEEQDNGVVEEIAAMEQLDSAEVVEEKSDNVTNEEEDISLNEQCASVEEGSAVEEIPLEEQSNSFIMVEDHENEAKQEENPPISVELDENVEKQEETSSSVELDPVEIVEGLEKSVLEKYFFDFEDEWGLAELFNVYEVCAVEETQLSENLVAAIAVVEEEESPFKEQCGSAEIVEAQEDAICSVQTEQVNEEEEVVIEELDTVKEETLVEKVEEAMIGEVVVVEETIIEEALVENVEEMAENQKKTSLEEDEKENKALPDCLLMMLCEPKLSMEVSKETWVCSTDYIRRSSHKPGSKIKGGNEVYKNSDVKSLCHSQQQYQQFSPYPAPSMTTMIEQKLMNAVAYEPFVLTRCKSAPLRSSIKLAPEACFWKNSAVELPPGVGC